MSTTMHFDAAAAAQVERAYSTPDVAATRIAVYRAAHPVPGERVLDIGCGPGFLLRDLALAVGATGHALGIDLSAPMVEMAARRCEGLPQVTTQQGDAVSLPGAPASFDLATILQVYAYVTELDEALGALHRALKPGGRAVILDTDFAGVVWQSQDRARMQRVMTAFDAHVAWPDLPRVLPGRLRQAGFALERCEVAPIVTTTYHANTYIHAIARFIHGFVTSRGSIPRDEADAWLAEFDDLERAGAFLFALNRFIFVARKPA